MRSFGPLETAIMDVLWAAPKPLCVREVQAGLSGRDLAYTTVMTVLDKLYKKGWLHREQQGRAYLYTPSSSREAYTAELMTEVLSTSQDRQATLVRFIESMTPQEAAALRAALAAHAQGGGE